ncbi:MAG: M48 family metallopeptidase [Gammaproteobacteria bacterium]|nr:M48 family metallopeptidase [Gammaproteobacteria bacterium]
MPAIWRAIVGPSIEDPAISEQLSLLQNLELTDSLHVRVSGRARRMSIRVHPHGQVEVVVPRRTRSSEVQTFVGAHREWIERARRTLGVQDRPAIPLFPTEIRFRFVDKRWGVNHVPFDGPIRLRALADEIQIHAEQPGNPRGFRLLQDWLKQQGKRLLVPRLESLSRETGLRFMRSQIRLQRSRWGSCSSMGSISLNAAALFVEPALVDYLILHELSHTRHMNHSAKFWSLLDSLAPGARKLDRALNLAWRDVPPWLYRR